MNQLPSFICYACKGAYDRLPEKCECGESMFINVSHTIYTLEMYPNPPDETKAEEKPVKKKIKPTENKEDFGMFTGFVPTDYEDDVDMFGGMETEENFVTSTFVSSDPDGYSLIKAEFSITLEAMMSLMGLQMPYVIVATDVQTGEKIKMRDFIWTECGFRTSDTIQYETTPLVLPSDSHSIFDVKLFCEHQGKMPAHAIRLKRQLNP